MIKKMHMAILVQPCFFQLQFMLKPTLLNGPAAIREEIINTNNHHLPAKCATGTTKPGCSESLPAC